MSENKMNKKKFCNCATIQRLSDDWSINKCDKLQGKIGCMKGAGGLTISSPLSFMHLKKKRGHNKKKTTTRKKKHEENFVIYWLNK